MLRTFVLVSIALVVLVFSVGHGEAQRAWSGYELALTGSPVAVVGHPMRLRGTAYRVRGLAELVHAPRAHVRARIVRDDERPAEPTGVLARAGSERERAQREDGRSRSARAAATAAEPWVDGRADAEGRFELEIAVPSNDPTGLSLEVELVDGDEGRSFAFPLHVRSALEVTLRTDRRLYEPGEPVHVWALVRDPESLRPLAGETANVVLQGAGIGRIERTVTTGEDGVVSVETRVAERASEGHIEVRMTIRGERFDAAATVGTRTYERVLARITTSPEMVAPHAPVLVSVEVTTPSGAPVLGAAVDLLVDGQTHHHGTTEIDGTARFEIHAPAYLTHDTGLIGLSAEITHPAHGSTRAHGRLRLAVPLTLTVEAAPRLGAGLVPEVDDVVYLLLSDGAGDPPPAGTEVEVEGAAVRGGRARAVTDANGVAEVPARLPPGAWSTADDGLWHTSMLARVRGPLERTARLSVAVQRGAEVAPRVTSPVVDPGAPIDVDVARGPRARGKGVVVELLDGLEVLAVRYLTASGARVRFDAPRDRLGLLSVRARAIHEGESAEGGGAIDRVLVRPARPAFVELRTERTQYVVGERARVSLVATPGDRGFAAVLVRDLAAHAGEVPFRRDFLEHAFDEAVLAPSGADADRFVRVTFAAHGSTDAEPERASPLLDALGLPEASLSVSGSSAERGVLRDPFPLARELERRGLGEWMMTVEQRLEEALGNDALDEVASGRGAARTFRSGLLDGAETLGGGAVEVAHLEAIDPSFRFDNVARRIARARLVRLLVAMARYLDPGDEASVAARMAAREPSDRWLPRMIERGLLTPEDLRDPWGGRFTLRRTTRPAIAIAIQATELELVSPGPDGRAGTADDVRDPFARAVPAGTPYAVVSGEDALMRSLALLSPAARTLAAIGEAYIRITAEMTEEMIGDAVHAGVSEGVLGLGLTGTGGGGSGSGSGYGHGSGRGSIGLGSVGTIGHGSGSPLRGLARVLRQRFPATLLFRPSIALDPSGVTTIEIPLADSVTSYVIETIVWRPDGWMWSAATEISVDREVVVESPVPEIARIGDEIEMPVRVGNRGAEARDLLVRVLAEETIGIAETEARRIRVGANDAVVEHFTIRPAREGQGRVRVAVSTIEGEALDAIEQPMRVVTRSRRARTHDDALVVRSGELTLTIPDHAAARDGEIVITSGGALFGASDDPAWSAWTFALGAGGAREAWGGATLARRSAAQWSTSEVPDAGLSGSLRQLTRELDDATAASADPATRLDVQARMLLDLAPLAARIADRAALTPEATMLIERLRLGVAQDAAAATDDAEALALGAAALAWTSRERDPHAVELLRRAERSLISVGDERFVAAERDPLRATILFAMADAAVSAAGGAERALALVRTLARWASRGGALSSEVRALARVTIARLGGDRPATSVSLWIDGERIDVPLTDGAGRIDRAALAAPGAHTVRVEVPPGDAGDALVLLRASATFGLPWETTEVRGPLALALEGEIGQLDGTSELELVVRNRTPRTIARPIVEVDLPTGAELTEGGRAWIAAGARRAPDRAGDVLTIELTAMPPGALRRIRLPLRWSVAGTVPGLGVVGYAADRPESASVLPPRALVIEGGAQ